MRLKTRHIITAPPSTAKAQCSCHCVERAAHIVHVCVWVSVCVSRCWCLDGVCVCVCSVSLFLPFSLPPLPGSSHFPPSPSPSPSVSLFLSSSSPPLSLFLSLP